MRSFWQPSSSNSFPAARRRRGVLPSLILAGVAAVGIVAHADESLPPIWGEMLLATSDSSLLPRNRDTEQKMTAAFVPADSRAPGDARRALMSFDGVVLLAVVTLADKREETYHVPRTTGEMIDIYHGQLILGGTVLAFSPKARTVLATAPVLGMRRLLLRTRPPPERLRDETASAAAAFAQLAQERGAAIGSRSRRAPIKRKTLGGVLLGAGRVDGVRTGLIIAAVDPSTGNGVDCRVGTVNENDADLDCPTPPPNQAMGEYLRSVGEDVEKYQVLHTSITSAKAKEVLRDSLASDEAMIAFAASDRLAARGRTVLPPGGEQGEMLTQKGVREFASRHGISDRQLADFTLKFPPPEVQVEVVVDGYNTSVAHGGAGVKRSRIHKAWATASDNHGHHAEGIGVEVIEEIEEWQEEAPQAADARQAILNAVTCATSRLIGEAAKECA